MIRKHDSDAIGPYLKDASNYSGGWAEEVIIPESVSELSRYLQSDHRPVTISGAGTGMTASRIPNEGTVVSLERFNSMSDVQNGSIDVGPAVTLKDLQDYLEGTPWFYPPNPTEALASIGGNLATNASGSRSFKFGVTRDYVVEADIVLSDGGVSTLSRGKKVSSSLELDDGRQIPFPDVKYTSPVCKNAAGYYVQPGMDWLDLFIGSDGTLGIFTRIRLRLVPRPDNFLSGILFFWEEEFCWDLIQKIRSLRGNRISPCSLEYFDRYSLVRLRSKHALIPDYAQAALFFEQDVERQEDYDSDLEAWYEFLRGEGALLDDSWFAQNERDIIKFHDFRHDIPAMLNEENSRLGRVKIGTDMAVPDSHFMEMMKFYETEIAASGLDYVMFGHLGDNHLHINFLPEKSEIEKAKKVYEKLVDQVLKWDGTVSAEHGIGKLKKEYLARMVGPEVLEEFKKIKRALDPGWRLGLGNII